MSLLQHHAFTIESMLSLIPQERKGWVPTRLIFFNWWLWTYQVLHFAEGRMALTGQNAGGKSTLLALIIPVLLDGDTSPRRLDPALSRDRFLSWFLLGPDENNPDQPGVFAYRARIGYVALEFRQSDGRYLTIGIGVSASRSTASKIRSQWGFVIPDRRVGKGLDIDLHDDDGICLSEADLRNHPAFGSKHGANPTVHPVITTDRAEYRQAVNDALFGMSDDDYRGLMQMLLRARQPKLNPNEPGAVGKVCSDLALSLPAIPDEQYEVIGSVVSNLENHQRNSEEVAAQAELALKVDKAQADLAAVLVQAAAAEYMSATGRYGNQVRRMQEKQLAQRTAEAEALAQKDESSRLQGELKTLRARSTALTVDDPGLADLPNRYETAKANCAQAKWNFDDATSNVENTEHSLKTYEIELENLADDLRRDSQLVGRQLLTLAGQADQTAWPEAAGVLRAAKDDTVTLRIDDEADEVERAMPDPAVRSDAQRRARLHRDLAAMLEEQETAAEQFEAATKRMGELEGRYRQSLERQGEAVARLEERRGDLDAAVLRWANRYEALDLPGWELAQIRQKVSSWIEPPEGGYFALANSIRSRLAERLPALKAERDQYRRAAEQAEAEAADIRAREALLRETGLHPDRTAVRTAARKDAPGRALYEWIRFRFGVPESEAALVEAAGFESGLFDLLVDTSPQPVFDAWLTVRDDNPALVTLASVLEPEDGAPDIVSTLLLTVGYGNGQGTHWLAPDGRWQHGTGAGQTAPWANKRAFLTGTLRREAALSERLAELQEKGRIAFSAQEAALLEATEAQEAYDHLTGALEAFGSLPWQSLFTAMGSVNSAREQAERDRQDADAFRPQEQQARSALTTAENAVRQFLVAKLPSASGLDIAGVHQRMELLQGIDGTLANLQQAYLKIGQTLQEAARIRMRVTTDRHSLERRLQARSSAQTSLGAAQAALQTIEQQMQRPDVAVALAERRHLDEEINRLDRAEREAREAFIRAEERAASAGREAADMEPGVAELNRQRLEHLDRLRERLALHPTLEPLLQELGRHGEVATLPNMPRPVADERVLAEVIERFREDLKALMPACIDLLGDYRPALEPTRGDRVVFFDQQRQPVSAGELACRFEARHEQIRQLVDEGEKELYERIICNQMLDVLQHMIAQAHRFTDQMNARLGSLAGTDGETLSLKLTLRDEEAGGSGIGRALEALDQHVRWLSVEMRTALVDLIRHEVARVRDDAAANGRQVSYTEAIATALDYRTWYVYRLYSHYPGLRPKEIQDRGFGTRSNSQKAWALIVPILAGVAARYDAAGAPGVPRLVGLDEIFAGYDAGNQMRYLQYLEALDLCWIINCPEDPPYGRALPAVVCYEMSLLGGVHTATPSLWDGRKVRNLLDFLAEDGDSN